MRTPEVRPTVDIDAFVVMPNHLHAIVVIDNDDFHGTCTKQINLLRGTPRAPVWQRGYYETIMRNEHMLRIRRQYIIINPPRWAIDKDNPANIHQMSS